MKNKLLFTFLILLIFCDCQLLNGQVTVSGSNTKDGTYTSLTKANGAFAALNITTQASKTIIITITADVTDEDGANALTGAAGMWTSLTINPSGGEARTISGSVAKPLIDLNGADNVTINGLNSGSNSLTISNLSTSATPGTSTIRFINDASANTVEYCTIKGSEMVANSATAGSGIIFFSTSNVVTLPTGNDGNLIDNNNITNAGGNRPLNAIYSLGITGANLENSGNTISNNNIYDFLNKATVSYGINLGNFNTIWSISGNSFYETGEFVQTAADNSFFIINIASGNDYTITNNYIGGREPQCGGLAMTKTGAYNNIFNGIYLSVGNTTASNIKGNFISNISWTNASYADFNAIYAKAGTVNIGGESTADGNIIGSATGTGSITYTNATAGGNFYGIYAGTAITTIKNNTVGGITVANTPANGTYFNGIYKSYVTGNFTCSYNTVGHTTVANSIDATSASTVDAQYMYGIYCNGTGTNVISQNTVANLNNRTSCTTSAIGWLKGI